MNGETAERNEKPSLKEVLSAWRLPEGETLSQRIEAMVRPAVFAGYFGADLPRLVAVLSPPFIAAREIREMAERVALTPSDRLLEVGCFLGAAALEVAQRYWCQVTGVDFDAAIISGAKRVAEVAGLSGLVDFRTAPPGELPFADRFFTVLWAREFGAHDEHLLREFLRVLEVRGRAVFMLRFRGPAGSSDEPGVKWSLEEAAECARTAGFEVRRMEDMTARFLEEEAPEIEQGLSAAASELAGALGEEGLSALRASWASLLEAMRAGRLGQGRITAVRQAEEAS